MGCLACNCTCNYFDQQSWTPSGNVDSRYTEIAGDFSFDAFSNKLTTPDSNAILICNTVNPQNDPRMIVQYQLGSVGSGSMPLGVQYRSYLWKDIDNYLMVEVTRFDSTMATNPEGDSYTNWNTVSIWRNDAGTLTQVGDTRVCNRSWNIVPGNFGGAGHVAISWDGTFLGVAFASITHDLFGTVNGSGGFQWRIDSPPADLLQGGVGVGSNSHATIDWNISRFTLAYDRSFRSNCKEIHQTCAHCSTGQWPTSWIVEFTNVTNGCCPDTCNTLNSTIYTFTPDGPPTTVPEGVMGSSIDNMISECEWRCAIGSPNTCAVGSHPDATFYNTQCYVPGFMDLQLERCDADFISAGTLCTTTNATRISIGIMDQHGTSTLQRRVIFYSDWIPDFKCDGSETYTLTFPTDFPTGYLGVPPYYYMPCKYDNTVIYVTPQGGAY